MSNVQQISILCTKPVKNINTEAMGWIRPDGIINFATKDAAKKYAINRCVAANKLQDKFERAVVVKDNMILTDVDGKLYRVNVNHRKLSKYKDSDFYHNHPTPGTLSSPDFSLLILRNYIKTITAIDINNRYYTMSKLPLKKIKFLPGKFSDFITKRLHVIKSLLKYEKIEFKYFSEIKNKEKEIIEKQKQMTTEELRKTSLAKEYLENVYKMCTEMHEMWKENAESLGVKYEYGNLQL